MTDERHKRYYATEKGKAAKASAYAKWSSKPGNKERKNAYVRKCKGIPAPTYPAPAECECCGGRPNGRSGALHADHDHATGLFRGWLCIHCNMGLGLFKDSIDKLMRAAYYLKRSQETNA